MPLFEFGCASCGRRFEQLITHRNLTADIQCPFCGSDDVSKLVSTFATTSKSSDSSGASENHVAPLQKPAPQMDHCGVDWRN
ncbi:MAG: zinc ribbon domain-containing protein [Myxococcales bacterium]|nr:zinc ribbon domain-containing protein [Myxococcales bacterium]MCB9643936.1 zinc ribbon domain-containing protein [Myxococcales bacterium]